MTHTREAWTITLRIFTSEWHQNNTWSPPEGEGKKDSLFPLSWCGKHLTPVMQKHANLIAIKQDTLV